MSSIRAMWRTGTAALAAVVLVGVAAAPASAQDRNSGNIRLSGGLDIGSGYMFRGFRQDMVAEVPQRIALPGGGGQAFVPRKSNDLVVTPYLDLGVQLYEGDRDLRGIGLRFATVNRFHTGPTGLKDPVHAMWNAMHLTTSVVAAFPHGTTAEMGFNQYTSANGLGLSARELFIRVDVDDSHRGNWSLKPHGLVAGEFDVKRQGSANCGNEAHIAQRRAIAIERNPALASQAYNPGCRGGSYLEVGIRPSREYWRVKIEMPVTMGFSIKDYFLHPVEGTDSRIGFGAIGLMGETPLFGETRYGSWVLRGGAEWHMLSHSARGWNPREDGRGAPNRVTVTGGVGFTY